MTYKEYIEKRNAMMNEARQLFADGKKDEAKALKDQIPALDTEWEEQTKFDANMRALEGDVKKVNIQNLTGDPAAVPAAAPVAASMATNPVNVDDACKSESYVNAWAKTLMGKTLTADESKSYEMVNSTLETGTTGVAIVVPTTVSDKIWQEIEDQHPFIADIAKTYVKGKLTLIVEDTSSDAAWYDEQTPTADGSETFATIELAGCELSRAITISWKLKEMSIPDFTAYIVRKMAERMGAGLSYGALQGKGPASSTTQHSISEPEGILTGLDTAQIVATGITFANLAKARGLIKSGYTPKIYANANTIWNDLVNVLDDNKRPIFIMDATQGGVYRIFGCEVKEEAGMPDGQVLFSDAARGYTMNINKQVSLSTEDHVKARTTDYCGYAIVDGAITTQKASALVK